MAHLSGSIGYPGQTSELGYSSGASLKIPLGTRARDGAGNEYIYLDYNAAKAAGEIVSWDGSYLASAVGATTVGPIGVVCGEASSSDLAGWVQIYGYCANLLASSSLTSGFLAAGATTDGYSVPVNGGASTAQEYRIMGMKALSAASTATSPGYASTASSILGVATAWLNYPHTTVLDVTS